MRLTPRSLPGVGRGLRRLLLAVAVVLVGAAAAMGISVAYSSPEREAARSTGPAVTEPRLVMAPPTPVVGLPDKKATRSDRQAPRRGRAARYRRTANKRVPANATSDFMPLYREAARTFGLDWRLIASIHRQETAFSTASGTYRGLNAFGCCAGPMQFNVTNGPPSTWKLYRQAFREGNRPRRYPNRTDHHPSIYDDFDAIMAAGSLLRDSGARSALDGGAWQAAYSYYGHDLFGVTYANQILARAVAWQRRGFCLNCGVDAGLAAEFERDYGAAARQKLIAADRRRAQEKARKRRAKRERQAKRERERERREERRKRGNDGPDDRARDGTPSGERRPSPPPPAREKPPAAPPGTTTAAPPGTTTAAPPGTTPPPETSTAPVAPVPSAAECSGVNQLLGC